MTMITGPARLYGVDSPATGEDVKISILGTHLDVRTAEKSLSCSLTSTRVREVGTGRMGLEFAWDTDYGTRAVQVFDPTLLEAIRANADMRALPQMASVRSRQRRGSLARSLGIATLVVFLLFPLLLFLLFIGQADRIAEAVASRVPIEQEVRLGDQAFAAMSGSLNLQDKGPAFDAVQAVGAKLTQGSNYRYRFHVVDNDAINAFALPGGIVVVNSGLIAATRRPEELAGVLAHEVQHVELRHSLRSAIKDLGLRGLWMLLTGDVGSGIGGSAALELTSLRFSRDAEEQADANGFDALIEADIDPRGMADFFTVMAEKDGSAAPPPFLSTHPTSENRERALRVREQEIEGRDFVALDSGPWPPVKNPQVER